MENDAAAKIGGFRKVNAGDVAEVESAKLGRQRFGRRISEALGREPDSTDLMRRHPFDVEVQRIPAGAIPHRYHSHSAQWEFYYVLAGSGAVRHAVGQAAIGPGDAFLFKPGEPHQLLNDGDADLVVMVVADNPIGEVCHYPDEGRWFARLLERQYVRLARAPEP